MNLLRLHLGDNVAITRQPVAFNERGEGLSALGDIPAMHKIATRAIARGEHVVKYGQPIGLATADIRAGEHVHTHNCIMLGVGISWVESSDAGAGDLKSSPKPSAVASVLVSFNGFRRPNGTYGTRNLIGIVTTVNCSATVAKQIAAQAGRSGLLADFPNVDGVVAITHGSGCGMDSRGEGFDLLKRTLDGYIAHPNFGGVLVVGLGCEVMQASRLDLSAAVRKLEIQSAGGTRASVEEGLRRVRELCEIANACTREPAPASELVLALQCGGSDGYSGITANPALGVASDLLVSRGGSVILSETPEIYGAEHLLLERARVPEVAQKLVERLEWWREYAARHGGTLDANPSPGNIAGGITTILEKSLGAQAKSGSSPLNSVIRYAEKLETKGFTFMDSPGYDPVSVTGQVASGANVICFTTGRGSAFGFKPVPSIKLATNTEIYHRMRDDMDLNCGTIIDAGESVEACGQRIFDLILAVASGQRTCSEELDYGDNEFTPWQLGAVY